MTYSELQERLEQRPARVRERSHGQRPRGLAAEGTSATARAKRGRVLSRTRYPVNEPEGVHTAVSRIRSGVEEDQQAVVTQKATGSGVT